MPAIDPSFLTSGGEWSVGGVGGAGSTDGGVPVDGTGAGAGSGSGFGKVLVDQISKLEDLQVQAGDASRAIADGTASDPSAAVVAVERARMAMQLAAQLRTKGIEAFNDVFHTQV
jgi:flagellar hook-basal body complex protein FliE